MRYDNGSASNAISAQIFKTLAPILKRHRKHTLGLNKRQKKANAQIGTFGFSLPTRQTQKMMGTLSNIETHTINYHFKKIFSHSELDENSVIRNFRITANDG